MKKLMKNIVLGSTLVLGAMSANATDGNAVPDLSFMHRDVKTPGFYALTPNGHPLANDELAGKELVIFDRGMELIKLHFTDETTAKWWFPVRPDIVMENPFAAFKITKGIYLLTWVENESFAPPLDPSIDLATWQPKWYGHDTSTTFVLDLNKKVLTDSYMQPDIAGSGSLQFNIVQGDILLRDIPKQ